MRILIIPDVHGRDFWKEPCQHIDEFDKVVFLGDYHDPYTHQVSVKTSRHMLRDELIPFVKKYSDKVICLYGNHDNYIINGDCCRHDNFHYEEIKNLISELNPQLIYQVDSYLFSHSGILPEWLDLNGLTLKEIKNLKLNHPALEQISTYRGGYDRVGSCIWGDVREYNEQDHIPDIYQIFGHTQLYNPIIKSDYACLDCRQAFTLNTETGELKPFWINEILKYNEQNN